MRDLLSARHLPVPDERTCEELRELLGQIAWQLAQRGVKPEELCRVCSEGLRAFDQLVVAWHAQRLNDFEKYVSNHNDQAGEA